MILLADDGSNFGAGFIAFFVVAALGVALYFLIRSMNRHLKRVPPSFESDADSAPQDDVSPRRPTT